MSRGIQMTVDVNFFTLDGIAYAPGDVSFGDAETLSPPVNTGTVVLTIPLRRRSLTLNARGVTENTANGIDGQRDAAVSGLAGGNPSGTDIKIGPLTLADSLLLDYSISAPIIIAGKSILETMSLTYQAATFG